MEDKKVFHFIFCEDKYEAILDSSGKIDKEDPGPFTCDMLQLKQPILLVADILHFEMFLTLLDKEQNISVWVHRQANNKKEGRFGSYKGEEIGEALITRYPKLEFKYITRASNPDRMSEGKHPKEIVEKKYIIEEFIKPENWNKISDFKEEKSTSGKTDVKEQNIPSINVNVNAKENSPVSIILGDNNTQNNDIKVTQLTNTLTQNGLSSEDVTELLEILKSENHNQETHTFGKKTDNWIQKNIGKVQKVIGVIATGAAGKLLADAIKLYLGWV
jgi:hypothetical protein